MGRTLYCWLDLIALLLSWPYVAAMSAGTSEYLLELRFLPVLKQLRLVSFMGLGMVLLGEAIRKLAMVGDGMISHHVFACS